MQSYGLDAYRVHDLSITMQTSSGDRIAIDLSNSQSLSMHSRKDENGTSSSFSFSSMQAFSFSVDTNGISEQDRMEIAAFMEIARPYIEDFMSELQDGKQTTPRNAVARSVAAVFDPLKGNGNAVENHAKNGIVSLFDDAAKKAEAFGNLLDEMQKLMEKSLEYFDRQEPLLYA